MINGESNLLSKDKRLSNRIYILSNLDNLIKESVYYRTYSEEINSAKKVVKIKIIEKENKQKIL